MKKPNSLLLAGYIFLLCFFFQQKTSAQDSGSVYTRIVDFPNKFFGAINNKTTKLQQRLNQSSEKYLQSLVKKEKKMRRKLARKDPAAAKELFSDVDQRYDSLRNVLNNPTAKLSNVYSGHLDSMKTALGFLQSGKVLDQSPAMREKLNEVVNQYGDVQGKLNQTHFIEQQIRARQQFLQQRLKKFGMAKEFRQFQGKVYYYRAQLEEYKNVFEQPSTK